MMSFFIVACALFAAYSVFANPGSSHAEARAISIAWKIIENGSSTSAGPSTSELVLKNNSSQTFGNNGWQIYFNFCRKILPHGITEGVRLKHINGDLFCLEPEESFLPFRPGTQRAIRFHTNYSVIKESDAPSGFYLVSADNVRRQQIVESLGDAVVGPITSKHQTMRTRDDQIVVPTAHSRFRENESLSQVPVKKSDRILPTPVSCERRPGTFSITSQTAIVAGPQLEQEAAYLAAALQPLMGDRLQTNQDTLKPTRSTIVLSLQDLSVDGNAKTSGSHAYQLIIDQESGISITGTDPTGVFYGIQTLRAWLAVDAYKQSQDELTVEAVAIVDAPRFGYRGLHLDVARNFQEPDAVKRLLEMMSFYKLNKFHFHLTDDEGWRLEIAELPELTEIGSTRAFSEDGKTALPPSFGSGPDATDSHGSGYYSREEFIEILQFAAERHIDVIPEIDLPGHARAAIQAMAVRHERLHAEGREKEAKEFLLHDPQDNSAYESVQMWNDNVVNVCQDSTYSFVQHVLADIRTIYAEAGARLTTVHLGGDEVPEGVWDESPECKQHYPSDENRTFRGKDAMADFFSRVTEFLPAEEKIVAGAWEEVFLNDMKRAQVAQGSAYQRFLSDRFHCYVWNNVWGWGQEDMAYRLANSGVNVVLCNATHLYFDLAYNKDPKEPGYYWAGFVDTKTAYSFAPLNFLARTPQDIFGHDISTENIDRRTRLTEKGKKHVLGIQGQLWGENLKGQERLEYMAFPRLIALAERAWSQKPVWASEDLDRDWQLAFHKSWSRFARQLGTIELPRLDHILGGFEYRIPDPGALIKDGVLKANVAFPGLTLRYTTDGSEPQTDSKIYTEPVEVGSTATISVFTSNGRSGRPCTVREKNFQVN